MLIDKISTQPPLQKPFSFGLGDPYIFYISGYVYCVIVMCMILLQIVLLYSVKKAGSKSYLTTSWISFHFAPRIMAFRSAHNSRWRASITMVVRRKRKEDVQSSTASNSAQMQAQDRDW